MEERLQAHQESHHHHHHRHHQQLQHQSQEEQQQQQQREQGEGESASETVSVCARPTSSSSSSSPLMAPKLSLVRSFSTEPVTSPSTDDEEEDEEDDEDEEEEEEDSGDDGYLTKRRSVLGASPVATHHGDDEQLAAMMSMPLPLHRRTHSEGSLLQEPRSPRFISKPAFISDPGFILSDHTLQCVGSSHHRPIWAPPSPNTLRKQLTCGSSQGATHICMLLTGRRGQGHEEQADFWAQEEGPMRTQPTQEDGEDPPL